MAGSIQLTGLASNDPVPGEYYEISFAQGPASLGTQPLRAILIGGKLVTGSATADTVVYGPTTPVSMTSEQDAIALFGAGSELHRMVRRFMEVNTTTPLFAIAVSDGYGAVQAEGTITMTGTATSAGTFRVFVGDEFVDTGFVTNDAALDVLTDAVTAINSKTHWPCTAAINGSNLELTAKQPGLRGNMLRYFVQILPSGTGLTASPTASTTFSGGSVSDDITDALASIVSEEYYYIGVACEDSSQLVDVMSQVNTQALPVNGIRQRVFAGSVDTISNSIAVVDSLNAARAEIQWLYQSDWTPGELAANMAAVASLEEAGANFRCNFDFYGQDAVTSTNWKLKAPLSGAKPTRSQIFAALNAGLSPIAVDGPNTYLVKRITTRYKNGSVVDYRIRDSHKVTVCDRYTKDLQAKMAATIRGKKLANDPLLNEPAPDNSVVTPRVVKALIDALTQDYADLALLQRAAEIKANTLVIRDSANNTRIGVRIPLQPIDILDSVAVKVDQVA